MKFLIAYADPGQPYSCNQWGNMPDGGACRIVEDTGYNIHSLYNLDNYFPSTIFITHEMQVYDKMNNAGSWSIGSRIDQMLEDCGDLCIDGGCSTSAGDVNEDDILNIQDLITMVNHILGSSFLSDCALEAADMNTDTIVNIQDLITLVNSILGSSRSATLDGRANVNYMVSGDDMIINIESDVDVVGIQMSVSGENPVDFELKDNSHIIQKVNNANGVNNYLAYSMFNQAFDSRTNEILIKSAGNVSLDNIEISIADINGDLLYLAHSNSGAVYQTGPHVFELEALYPNPFNPSTEVSFSLPSDGHVKLSVYDIRGQEVAEIFEGSQSVGNHSYTWNASDLSSGVYYVRLQSGNMVTSQKALLVK